MKQIILSLMTLFLLFSQKANGCGFILSQFMNVYSSPIQVGATDTLASWRFVSDSCSAVTTNFTFFKGGTSDDSNYTNVKFYKDDTFLFTVPFVAGITTLQNYATTIPSHDTVVFSIIGETDSQATLNQTIWFNMNVTLTDSMNVTQVLPVVLGQMMTTAGCILSVKKDTTVQNQLVTPGTQKLIASYTLSPLGGCTFTPAYAVLNNTGFCANNALHNVRIKKGAIQLGATIPVLGVNSVVLFSDNITGVTTYDIYADIDTSAVDSSTVIMDFNIIATSPTPGYFLLVDSIGQTMTIDNPVGIPIGPCMTATPEVPTNTLLPRGTNVCLGAVLVSTLNCPIQVNSIQFGVYGTAATNYMGNVIIMKNNITPVGWAIPTMSFFNTVSMNENIPANSSDTFFVTGDLSALALLDNRTYKLDIVVNATDSSGNTYVSSILLAEKTIVDGPNAIPSINDEKLISIYPNPANDFIIVEGFSDEIEITDIAGRPFIKKVVSEKEKIDISTLAKGMYILRSNYQVVKFTKQ